MRTSIFAAVLACAASGVAIPTHAADEGDPTKGEKLFKRCKACHKLEEGAHGIGPSLHAIINRPVASIEGFKYSNAMKAYAGDGENVVWNDERLGAFLEKPKSYIKGTKMQFGGFKKPQQRADLISFLKKEAGESQSAE